MPNTHINVYRPVTPLKSIHVAAAVNFLKASPVYPGCHVWHSAGPPTAWERCLDAKVLCWHHLDVLRAPYLLQHALEHTHVAKAWLEVDEPVLYSVNAFCTRPDGPMRPDIQDWHRDTDDVKFVPMFVCLSDGVQQEVRTDDGQITHIRGSVGESFFSNTMFNHRGLMPNNERIIFWARWGVSEKPAAYGWDQTSPVDAALLGDNLPTDPKLMRSLRLLVQ